MVKKLLLAVLLGTFFSGIGAEDRDVMEQLLRRVDLVLFILEQNTVRMERYGLHELQSGVTFISKDLSREHCVFKIGLTEKNSCAPTVTWDQDRVDRIKIVAGKKRTYHLLLKKLVSANVQLENFEMICFDCVVDSSKTLKKDMPETSADWKSTVNIMVPAGDEGISMQLVVERRVDAACGLFVQNDVFHDVALCGKIKREEALDLGVLVEVAADAEVVEEAVVAEDTEEVPVPSSVFTRIKSGFVVGLGSVKKFFSTSWQKVWDTFSKS